MYFPYFITYMVLGFSVSVVVFIWALNNGQFKDQQRARYLPLKDDDDPPAAKITKIHRFETYALMFLVFIGLALSATGLIFALLRGAQP